ncbi:MAG: hypothetical protein KJ767_00355 [Nanoarchaeota archaeon]|nr:hypothetical protein [Nanoarchaeota archaeon]
MTEEKEKNLINTIPKIIRLTKEGKIKWNKPNSDIYNGEFDGYNINLEYHLSTYTGGCIGDCGGESTHKYTIIISDNDNKISKKIYSRKYCDPAYLEPKYTDKEIRDFENAGTLAGLIDHKLETEEKEREIDELKERNKSRDGFLIERVKGGFKQARIWMEVYNKDKSDEDIKNVDLRSRQIQIKKDAKFIPARELRLMDFDYLRSCFSLEDRVDETIKFAKEQGYDYVLLEGENYDLRGLEKRYDADSFLQEMRADKDGPTQVKYYVKENKRGGKNEKKS